jgi:hypothetical protein
MIPLAESFLPFTGSRTGMIDGRGNVGTQHAEHVEPYAPLHPQIFVTVAIDEETDSYNKAQQDPSGMGEVVGPFFSFRIMNGHNNICFIMATKVTK